MKIGMQKDIWCSGPSTISLGAAGMWSGSPSALNFLVSWKSWRMTLFASHHRSCDAGCGSARKQPCQVDSRPGKKQKLSRI